MNKISLIIEREYLTRVKKKSFIIMSIVGPLLIAALYAVPIALAMMDSTETRTVGVIDKTGEFKEALKGSETLKYEYLDGMDTDAAKALLINGSPYNSILYREKETKYSEKGIVLISDNQPSIEVKHAIQNALNERIRAHKIEKLGLQQSTLDSLKTEVWVETKKISKDGTEQNSSAEVAMAVSYVGALFIYFIIFLYGAQVMRGVIEEKTNRIIEVIISSVKPFQLMMGKILGVALVVLTQIAIWALLSSVLIAILRSGLGVDAAANAATTGLDPEAAEQIKNAQAFGSVMDKLGALNIPMIIFSFIFYFIGGYLTYAALFAAVGAAVDNETDSQQFMLPVSAPMILSFVVAINIIKDPNGPLAFWMSIIPFTSPIAMMVRIPQGVPLWELALSMSLLILAFIGTTWFAAKIYRTGILMYGKKPTYREIWKWIRHS